MSGRFKARWRGLLLPVIGAVGALILKLYASLLRIRIVVQHEKQLPSPTVPLVCVFWHGEQLFMPWVLRNPAVRSLQTKRSFSVLISAHFDGRVIARIISWFGIGSVAGSSSRGGVRAAKLLAERVKRNQIIPAITPDGPRGPRHVAKQGAAFLALQSGAMVWPMRIKATRAWYVRSWDQMIIPKPFSQVTILVGAPLMLDSTMTLENATAAIEAALQKTGEINQ